MDFSKKILQWYGEHRRELPWRQTRDPYRIWLSEVMLQQTRVAQGLPYYEKFVAAFPTVHHMARATEEELLKLWQGLGYYSRARNMHATARYIAEELGGVFPDNYNGLIALKGVGDYTASAIASICYNEPQPVVDGNVYRVLSRYFGVDTPINSTKGVKYFKDLAKEVMDPRDIREYNQGIMEFGAIQCAPQKPDCPQCPLRSGCVALATDRRKTLPVKLRKGKVSVRHFNYIVFVDGKDQTLMEQREGKGIWQGLYQFPLMETKRLAGIQHVHQYLETEFPEAALHSVACYDKDVIVHKLSHQHLKTRFWIVITKTNLPSGTSWSSVEEYPMPVLIADFIDRFKNDYFCRKQ